METGLKYTSAPKATKQQGINRITKLMVCLVKGSHDNGSLQEEVFHFLPLNENSMIRAKQAKAPFAYFVQREQLGKVAKHWFALAAVAVVASQIPYQHEFTSLEVLTTTLT